MICPDDAVQQVRSMLGQPLESPPPPWEGLSKSAIAASPVTQAGIVQSHESADKIGRTSCSNLVLGLRAAKGLEFSNVLLL